MPITQVKNTLDGSIIWSVYMIRCGDDSLYTGIATDVARRLDEHLSGKIGSKYLRGRAPLVLVLEQLVGNRSRASKIEYQIKKLSRTEKEKIVNMPSLLDKMILEISD